MKARFWLTKETWKEEEIGESSPSQRANGRMQSREWMVFSKCHHVPGCTGHQVVWDVKTGSCGHSWEGAGRSRGVPLITAGGRGDFSLPFVIPLVGHPPLPGSERETHLQMDLSLIDIKYLLWNGNFYWFSELLCVCRFLKITSVPKRHILGWQNLLPYITIRPPKTTQADAWI